MPHQTFSPGMIETQHKSFLIIFQNHLLPLLPEIVLFTLFQKLESWWINLEFILIPLGLS